MLISSRRDLLTHRTKHEIHVRLVTMTTFAEPHLSIQNVDRGAGFQGTEWTFLLEHDSKLIESQIIEEHTVLDLLCPCKRHTVYKIAPGRQARNTAGFLLH